MCFLPISLQQGRPGGENAVHLLLPKLLTKLGVGGGRGSTAGVGSPRVVCFRPQQENMLKITFVSKARLATANKTSKSRQFVC